MRFLKIPLSVIALSVVFLSGCSHSSPMHTVNIDNDDDLSQPVEMKLGDILMLRKYAYTPDPRYGIQRRTDGNDRLLLIPTDHNDDVSPVPGGWSSYRAIRTGTGLMEWTRTDGTRSVLQIVVR